MRSRAALSLVVMLALLAVPLAAAAQTDTQTDGVLVRVNGDAVVEAGEELTVVVVVNGDLTMSGIAETVVVVDGTATLTDATVETVVVVSGVVDLRGTTVVNGDVVLPDSFVMQDPTVSIEGSVVEGVTEITGALVFFGLVFVLGLGVLTLLGALAFAAVAPGLARKAGLAIREEFGSVVVAGAMLWIVLPVAAGLLLITVIAIPTSLAVWMIVMPAFALLGWLVSAIFIGELLVDRDQNREHPYLAALAGAAFLMLANVIPIIGPIITIIAVTVGGAALAVLAWRAFRGRKAASQEATLSTA